MLYATHVMNDFLNAKQRRKWENEIINRADRNVQMRRMNQSLKANLPSYSNLSSSS